MRTNTWKGALILLSLAMALMLVVAACGDDEDEATTTTTTAPAAAPTTAPEPAPDAMMEEKPTLIFSDLDWPSAQIQNAIARRILEDGYGYETDAVFGGTIPLLEALARGDTNVTMEIWLPNQQDAYEQASDHVIEVGNSLEDNWQSAFIIPNYTAEANPGLRSVEDLKNPEYMELFVTPDSKGKARLLNCIPGWECEGINLAKVENYGLTDFVEPFNPGSDTALAAEITSAFEQEEDVLFYYWGPTVISNKLNTEFDGYTILEEEPNSDECFAEEAGAERYTCAYPLAEVLIVVRKDVAEKAPDVIEFFEKWDFNAGNQLAAEGYLNDSGADYADVAVWFLANTEEWKNWVTPEALAAIEAASG